MIAEIGCLGLLGSSSSGTSTLWMRALAIVLSGLTCRGEHVVGLVEAEPQLTYVFMEFGGVVQ